MLMVDAVLQQAGVTPERRGTPPSRDPRRPVAAASSLAVATAQLATSPRARRLAATGPPRRRSPRASPRRGVLRRMGHHRLQRRRCLRRQREQRAPSRASNRREIRRQQRQQQQQQQQQQLRRAYCVGPVVLFRCGDARRRRADASVDATLPVRLHIATRWAPWDEAIRSEVSSYVGNRCFVGFERCMTREEMLG